jgi:hypothetical protein
MNAGVARSGGYSQKTKSAVMIKRITQLEKQKEIIGYLLPELSQISDKN